MWFGHDEALALRVKWLILFIYIPLPCDDSHKGMSANGAEVSNLGG